MSMKAKDKGQRAASREARRSEASIQASATLSFGKLCDSDLIVGTGGFATESQPFNPRKSVPGDLDMSGKHGVWSKEADFIRVKKIVGRTFGQHGEGSASRAHIVMATRAVLGINSKSTIKGYRGSWSSQHLFCIMQMLERMRTVFNERDTINDVIIGCGKAAKRAVGRLLKVSLQRSDFDSDMLYQMMEHLGKRSSERVANKSQGMLK